MPAYALFLEPDEKSTTTWSKKTRIEHALEWCIVHGQGKPSLVHVELLIINDQDRHHFATYLGDKAGFREHDQYYTQETAGRWRAVPIPIDTVKLLLMCNKSSGSKYSILRYVSTLRPFRWLGHLLPNRLDSPGHCATLVARLVHAQSSLKYNTNNYGPVMLYHSLTHKFLCSGIDQEPACEMERSLYEIMLNRDLYDQGAQRVRLCEKTLARHVLYNSVESIQASNDHASLDKM